MAGEEPPKPAKENRLGEEARDWGCLSRRKGARRNRRIKDSRSRLLLRTRPKGKGW
jgi:hypothetical protein